MTFSINKNITALNALRHLGKTDATMGKTLEHLSSGLKVNRSSDAPAALVVSEHLRGQLGSIDRALENSEASISMVQTAEAALAEVNNLLTSIRQLTIHAANEGANDAEMLAIDQTEIEHALESINRIAQNSRYGTRVLFDGSNGASGVAVGEGLEFIHATPETNPSGADGYKVDILRPATRAIKHGLRPMKLEDFRGSDPVKLTLSTGGRNITFDSSQAESKKVIQGLLRNADFSQNQDTKAHLELQLQEYVAQRLHALASEGGLKLDIFLSPNPDFRKGGKILTVQHREYGSKPTFSTSSTVAGILNAKVDKIETPTPGNDVEGKIGEDAGVGEGELLRFPLDTEVEGLELRFSSMQQTQKTFPRFVQGPLGHANPNPEIEELEAMASSTPLARILDKELVGTDKIRYTWEVQADTSQPTEGFVHVTQNALGFQVEPSSGGQVKISLLDMKTEKLGREVENSSDFKSLSDINVMNSQGAEDTLRLVDKAMQEVSGMRAELGAFQRNTLETSNRSLTISRENLTSAESSLRDADMAQEMSELAKNQIMLTSGMAMLAQANQTPQSVLKLIE